jgi:hypothetical protein
MAKKKKRTHRAPTRTDEGAAMTSRSEDPIIALARDLSGGDPQIIAQARRFVDEPPTTIEEIGFYGCQNAAAEARTFLGVVAALAGVGHLYSIEDKYTPEIIARWIDDEVLVLDALPPPARSVFSTLADCEYPDLDEEEHSSLYERLMRNFAQATRAFEDQLAGSGKALLSIDATDGDTMFFAVVTADVAVRWQNKAFAVRSDGYRPGVRPAMWDRFWVHLSYALDFDDLDEADLSSLPTETRERDNDIPLVER